MRLRLPILRDDRGAAAIEMAFALPVLVVMLWAFVQLAQVYRAVAGIQQALGEGARYATLCYSQSVSGCAAPAAGTGTSPAANTIKAKIYSSVYGIGPGTFTVADPAQGTSGTATYYDLSVTYSQPTNLIMFPGPTMTLTRTKRARISSCVPVRRSFCVRRKASVGLASSAATTSVSLASSPPTATRWLTRPIASASSAPKGSASSR